MREPSREAREAAEALCPAPHDIHEKWAAQGWRCLSCITKARALDDFAEERVKLHEFDVGTYRKIIAYIAFVLTGDEESPAQDAADAIEQERDALRRRVAELEAVQDAFDDTHDTDAFAVAHWKARAEAAESALDEIAELDPEELDENDDEWGGAAVGGRAQEIAQEARRGRGDSVRASLPTRTENRP